MLISLISASGARSSEDYELFTSIDDAKINLLSGNFSVAITRDWPRVIFRHEVDPFSPTFEVSCPRMYIFNDTDEDGIFHPSEVEYTIFLDSNHVAWNLSTFHQDHNSLYGDYAVVGMDASVHAYIVGENETLAIPDWGILSFWFFIAEMPVTYEYPGGTYVIDGKTEMRMNFTLKVNSCLDSDGVVLEQLLQGGGTTNSFQLMESLATGGTTITEVSALIDERETDGDYPHRFNKTSDPMQRIKFAKEDGVVQAFYFWMSDADLVRDGANVTAPVNSSYFTNGAGMILHSILPVDNCTLEASHDSTVGIYESGFVGSVSDWIKEYLSVFVILCMVIIAVPLGFLVRRMRRRALARGDEEQQGIDPPGSGQR